jgi:hypothetical protein
VTRGQSNESAFWKTRLREDRQGSGQWALNGHLSVGAEYGDRLPDPSDIDAIVAADGSDEVGRILLRGDRPGKAVRVQVSMDEGLLARIDRVAANRSRFLSDAARAALAAQFAT